VYLLSQARAGGGQAGAVANYKGKLMELISKGVPGSLDCKTFNDGTPEIYFKATAWLDGATGIEEVGRCRLTLS